MRATCDALSLPEEPIGNNPVRNKKKSYVTKKSTICVTHKKNLCVTKPPLCVTKKNLYVTKNPLCVTQNPSVCYKQTRARGKQKGCAFQLTRHVLIHVQRTSRERPRPKCLQAKCNQPRRRAPEHPTFRVGAGRRALYGDLVQGSHRQSSSAAACSTLLCRQLYEYGPQHAARHAALRPAARWRH